MNPAPQKVKHGPRKKFSKEKHQRLYAAANYERALKGKQYGCHSRQMTYEEYSRAFGQERADNFFNISDN